MYIQPRVFHKFRNEFWRVGFILAEFYRISYVYAHIKCMRAHVRHACVSVRVHTWIRGCMNVIVHIHLRLRRFNRWLLYFNEWSGTVLNKEKKSLTTKCGERGVRMTPPAKLFLLWAFWLICFRACWQYASYGRKIIEILLFAVQIEMFPRNTFFALTPPALGSVAQSTHA